jgi:hypothetical protein
MRPPGQILAAGLRHPGRHDAALLAAESPRARARRCLPRRTPAADISRRAVHPAPAVRRQYERPPARGGDDLKENIMYTTTTQLADSLHGERLREADRARLAASARAASRSARRASTPATPASRIIRAILLRPAV